MAKTRVEGWLSPKNEVIRAVDHELGRVVAIKRATDQSAAATIVAYATWSIAHAL